MILCPRCKEHNEPGLPYCLNCGYLLPESRQKPLNTPVKRIFMMKKKKPLNDTYDEESSFTHAEEKIEDSSDKKEQEETVQNKPDIICPRCHSNCVQITSSEEMYNGTVFFIGQCRDCGKKGLFKLDL